jgi:hypothetical protein
MKTKELWRTGFRGLLAVLLIFDGVVAGDAGYDGDAGDAGDVGDVGASQPSGKNETLPGGSRGRDSKGKTELMF